MKYEDDKMRVNDIMTHYSIPDEKTFLDIFVKAGIIQEFPSKYHLNVKAICDEINTRTMRNRTVSKYIMYKLDEYYGKQGNPITSQEKYNGRKYEIFQTEFWNKPRYFELTGDEIVSELPLTNDQVAAINNLELDINSKVADIRELMGFFEFGHIFGAFKWDRNAPIVEEIIGGYPHHDRGFPLNLISSLIERRLNLDETRNILKYKEEVAALLNRILDDAILPRYKDIIVYRFKHHMRLDEIGDKMGGTGERIRQCEQKILRMLRFSSRLRGLTFFMTLKEELPHDVHMAIRKYLVDKDSYASKIVDIVVSKDPSSGIALIYRKTFFRELMLTERPALVFFSKCRIEDIDEGDPEDEEPIYLEDLGLSVRAFNCIKREGVNTLSELIDLVNVPGKLMSIRNLGQTTLLEILDTIKRFGYNNRIQGIPEVLSIYAIDDE